MNVAKLYLPFKYYINPSHQSRILGLIVLITQHFFSRQAVS